MIVTNLFQNIIVKQFKSVDKINIISGYGSGHFLKKVLELYPEMKINLFLGMTNEGISSTNHKIFQNLTKSSSRVNIYYQVKCNPNHMKVYSLYDNDQLYTSFVGSPNFTENGFMHNQEILVESPLSFQSLFDTQYSNSMICTDKKIKKYIKIYNLSAENVEDEEENKTDSSRSNYNKAPFKIDRLIQARNRASYKYYDEFELEIIKSNELNWAITGINSGFNDQVPHIPIGTKLFHEDKIPRDIDFTIETNNGEVFKVFSSSSDRGALFFRDTNIYEFIKNKVNLNERRPISRLDLEKANCTHVEFIRLDKLKYYVEFY